MHIDEDEVRRIAELARLDPRQSELARLARELEAVLGYMAQLDELDLEDVPPTQRLQFEAAALRPDDPAGPLPADTALAQAPDAEGGFFRVPRVFDE